MVLVEFLTTVPVTVNIDWYANSCLWRNLWSICGDNESV